MDASRRRPFWTRFFVVLLLVGGSVSGAADAQEAPDPAADTSGADDFAVPAPAPVDSVRAEDTGPQADRALVQADSLSTVVRGGQRLQELFDDVRVRQDTTRLRSNFALRYLDRDQLLFTGDVVIYERGDTLRADTVRYNKSTKVGYAWSNVRLTDGKVVVRAPRATYYTEEKRSVFPDSVTLIDSSRVLRAQSGTYWSNERRAEFKGHVRLTDPETALESDSLAYYRDQERSIAVGRVYIRRVGEDEDAPADTTTRTHLFGDWADNQEQNRYSRVEGNALLVRVRFDSTGAAEDTLVVRGRRLEAFRTDHRRRLIAVDSVRIWQTDLAAVADSAVYDRVVSMAPDDSAASFQVRRDSLSAPPSTDDRTPSPADTARPPADPPPAPDTSRTRPEAMAEAARARSPDAAQAAPRAAGRRAPPDSDTIRAGRRTPPDTTQGPPPPDTTQSRAVDDATQGRAPTDTTRPSDATRRRPPGDEPSPARGRRSREGRASVPAGNWGMPTAQREEDLPVEETRLYGSPVTWFERSQVWGDSIRVRSRNRSLDTVFVRGAAFAAQRDSVLDRIQQLKGKTLTAFFRADSLRRIVARPNARAIRFLASDADSLQGAAKASGDRIVLRFRDGSVRRTSIVGGVQSTYYRTPETIPDPFRLEGFQWTPERRPTKDGLLREDRVRDRLDYAPSSPRPPIASRSPPAIPVDSTDAAGAQPAASRPAPSPPGSSVVRPDSGAVRPDSSAVLPDSLARRLGAPAAPSDTSQTPSRP
jgi:lipopolysaccharide export system protein LptA